MTDNFSFKAYEINGEPVTLDKFEHCHSMDSLMYCLNTDNIYYRPPTPDTRSRLRKFTDEWRKRFSHAWYALKGYDCD